MVQGLGVYWNPRGTGRRMCELELRCGRVAPCICLRGLQGGAEVECVTGVRQEIR